MMQHSVQQKLRARESESVREIRSIALGSLDPWLHLIREQLCGFRLAFRGEPAQTEWRWGVDASASEC